MKYLAFLLSFLIVACTNSSKNQVTDSTAPVFDSLQIVQQLERMVKQDQAIQFAHTPDESPKVRDSLYAEKERIFASNTDTLKQLFKNYGYLGFDKIGTKGAHNFWLMTQHADHDLAFQEEILGQMLLEVKQKNADPSEYAYLTDRVLKNKGQKQLYGTQVQYSEDFWAFPLPLQDSATVNERREEVGLESIEAYLNGMMDLHYQMNPHVYEQRDMKGPHTYEVPE